jgi:uncharacterized protein with NAD-binding domain and iron-sulfur cluster
MAKQRVAVLGGGMAGLTAAYHLSRTQALRDRYDVTVYQMGWRLGGKVASGRDDKGRNLEHGLHVWFGCYENTFQLLQEIYAAWTPPPNSRFQTWRDVVKPQNFTAIGMPTAAGWTYVPIEWPENAGTPGDGHLLPTPWDVVTELLNLMRIVVERLEATLAGTAARPPPETISDRLAHALRTAVHIGEPQTAIVLERAAKDASPSALVAAAQHWAISLGSDPLRLGGEHPEGIATLFDNVRQGFGQHLTDPALPPKERLMLEAVEVFSACLRGMVRDLVLSDQPLMALDDKDFREWLLEHGADPRVVRESSIIRMVYDTAFLYEDGDPAHPNGAAGVALGGCLRLVGTYKGAMLWLLQGGMGECVIAPLYEVLVRAGVSFRFFNKVTRLELSEDGSEIATIHIAEQAEVLDGVYRPTFVQNGMRCWRSEPDWKQLRDGGALEARGANFESNWDQEPPVATKTLAKGADFDTVVLAIALGAYKPLNTDPSICQALMDRKGPFADFVQNMGIVPSLALQLWTSAPLARLGWTQAKPASVAGPEPMNIWADMTQVIAVEGWPDGSVPKGVHYLTGAYPTTLYKQAASVSQTPAQASAEVRDIAMKFLTTKAHGMWPLASSGNGFDWNLLFDPGQRTGEQRLDAQYWRANIDPTECTVGSPVGSTRFRLGPDASGFANLVLAGEATRQGFNASCIEGAVMSGMAAARAISSEPRTIIGYDFQTRHQAEFLL